MASQVAANVSPIRLGIVDDHPVIATAIAAAVAGDTGTTPDTGAAAAADGPPITIVGVARDAATGRTLLKRTGDDAPDVVLCDLHLGGGDGGTGAGTAGASAVEGLSLLDEIRPDGPKVIILTSFDRSSFMRAAFERGASGFLSKGTEIPEILRAVRSVAGGGTAFSAEALESVRSGPRPPSDREIAILHEVQGGATSEEIGTRLGISPRTVESHLRRLFDRYGVLSRTELAVLALREGWIADAG